MRHRYLIFLLVGLLSQVLYSQDNTIEELSRCGHSSQITELLSWGSGFLQISTCNGESIYQQTVAKTSLLGEVEWEVDFFGWDSRFRHAPDSSFWMLETGGCDFLDINYRIRHISKEGEVLQDFEGLTLVDDEEVFVDPGFMTYVNDSILAVQGWNSITYFNTNQLIFEAGPNLNNGNLLSNGVHSLNTNELAVCLSDSVLVLNYNGEISSYSDGVEFKRIWKFGQDLLVYKDDLLIQLDPQLNLVNSYQIMPGTELINLSVDDQIRVLTLESGEYSCIVLSDELLQMNQIALGQTDIFIPNSLLKRGEFYFAAGFNPNQSSSQAVFKVYNEFGASFNYEHDIELLSIDALGYSSSLMGEFNGTLIYLVTALYVNVEVRNNSELPISGFSCYALQVGIPGLCGQSIAVKHSNQVIQPGESYVYPFGNVILGFVNVDEGEEEYLFDFERCLWTQAPGGRMDRVPENDYLCHDFSGIITGIEEMNSWTSSFSYRSGLNQAVLESNRSCYWEIYDLGGRLISSGQATPGISVIELNSLSKGGYLFRYFSEDQNFTEKFIKN